MKIPRWASGENARKLLFIPPLALGVAACAWFVASQEDPVRRPVSEASRTLRVIDVPVVDVVPRVIGHGTSEPGRIWRAIAEVKGARRACSPATRSRIDIASWRGTAANRSYGIRVRRRSA